jgi:hypothetical protein
MASGSSCIPKGRVASILCARFRVDSELPEDVVLVLLLVLLGFLGFLLPLANPQVFGSVLAPTL